MYVMAGVAAVAFIGAAQHCSADPYTFMEIARASASPVAGQFSEFPNPPSINSLGIVAFNAKSGLDEGIYKGAGGLATTIAHTTGGVYTDFLSASSINTAGQVAFLAFTTSSIGVYRSDGVTTTTIASSAAGFVNVGTGHPSINSSGVVAFFGSNGTVTDGLFVGGAGGPPTAVYQSGDFGHSYAGDPAINDSGELSFITDGGSSMQGVAHGSGGAPVVVGAGYSLNSHTSISPSGTVVFRAKSFTSPDDAIWSGFGTASATAVADNAGPFSGFEFEAATSATTVAFRGHLDAGGSGIFTGPDPVGDKVLKTGDPLFGETVSAFPGGLNRFAVNDSGQITFVAILDNGDTVVVRATPGSLFGDYNDDGSVDAADYAVWRKHNNTMTTLPNDSSPGEVNDDDFDVWREHFGETGGGGSGAMAGLAGSVVPEPVSFSVALVCLLGFVFRVRLTRDRSR